MSIASFLKDESGVTAMEYAMLGALILCAVMGTLALIGPELNVPFTKVQSGLETANAKP